jgi:voltage-gated potassium channel
LADDRKARPPVLARLGAALSEPVRQLQVSIAVFGALIAVGTVGYLLILRVDAIDALYMTVITLTTLGYREVAPMGTGAKVFTIFLLAVGVVTVAWVIRNFVEATLGEAFWASVRRRRMKSMVARLAGHYIVCGYGRLGRHIVRDLEARGEPFVVVDWKPDVEAELLAANLPCVLGDATHEDVLRTASIHAAQGLVAALDSDAGNVLTILTARELNPALQIVARSNSEALKPSRAQRLHPAIANRTAHSTSMSSPSA